jgi:hypothetical protein
MRFFAAKASPVFNGRCDSGFRLSRDTPRLSAGDALLVTATGSDVPCRAHGLTRGFQSPHHCVGSTTLLWRRRGRDHACQDGSPACRLRPTGSLPRTPETGSIHILSDMKWPVVRVRNEYLPPTRTPFRGLVSPSPRHGFFSEVPQTRYRPACSAEAPKDPDEPGGAEDASNQSLQPTCCQTSTLRSHHSREGGLSPCLPAASTTRPSTRTRCARFLTDLYNGGTG